MITIWNQMEIYIGNPSPELKSILEILSAKKIKVKSRVFSDNSVHFLNSKILSIDLFNLKSDVSRIYYVYVHKKDYADAIAALQKQ